MLTARRKFLQMVRSGLCGANACLGLAGIERMAKCQSDSPRDAPKELSREEWMNAWMNSPSRGEAGSLYLSRFAEPIYFLTKPITWKPNADQRGYDPVTVPIGFVTDLASIPRLFWSALRPDGDYVYPAIVHDYMYWTQSRPRQTADNIFKLGMQDFDISSVTIGLIYGAVLSFGGASWDNNQKLRQAGEKRVLKRFPEDPHVRWKDWKYKADVFS